MPHKEPNGVATSGGRGVGDDKSKSSHKFNTSALYSVFGSQASLAELTGDVGTPSRPITPVSSQTQLLGGNNNNYTKQAYNTSLRGGDSSRRQQSSSPTLSDSSGSGVHSSRHTRSDSTSCFDSEAVSPDVFASGAKGPAGALISFVKIAILFMFGAAYGQFSKRLHDNHLLTTHTFDIVTDQYSLIWGSSGVVVGLLLPLVDKQFPEDRKRYYGKGGADWTSIVRAGAAFLGIAYGVKKIPWASTFQVAFYWGMINPCLWFLLDATRNGFILSSFVALAGTKLFTLFYPDNIPSPTTEAYVTMFALVASAFFCCSICIGNLGRRLNI